MPDAPSYLDRAAVAAALNLCERTLRRLEAQHGIPVLRLGRKVRYDHRAIAALEDACRSSSHPARVEPAYGSPAPSPPPARRKGSASDAVLAAMTQILRDHHHGERRGARGWAEAVASYRAFQDRSPGTIALLIRLTRHFRDTPLRQIDQAAIDRASRMLLRPGASAATRLRNVITPTRAVLQHAARRGWCDPMLIESPAVQARRTPCLTPEEFEALRAAMIPHHQALLTWLVGTGCRRGETWALDWADVDLGAARARLWADTTKAGRSRLVNLPPAVVATLASLRHRTGPVFGSADPRKALATAARAASVRIRGVHDLRHTWASWHYALHRDLLRLREGGGWASVAQVEVYAHLLPTGHDDGVRRVWGLTPGWHQTLTQDDEKRGNLRVLG
jgi:integrase